MSADAGLDLFAAVRAAMIGDAFIQGKVAGRVFSSWGNQDVAHPLIRMSLGRSERFEIDGPSDPLDGSEADISVHVFTAEDAPIICRQIASKARDVLQDAPLALTGSETVAFAFRDIIQVTDPDDPKLQIAVVRFRAMTSSK